MKLKKPIITGFGEKEKIIEEVNIKEEDFTAKILLEDEREFLVTGEFLKEEIWSIVELIRDL